MDGDGHGEVISRPPKGGGVGGVIIGGLQSLYGGEGTFRGGG